MELETKVYDGFEYKEGCLPRTVTSPGDGTFPVFGETDGSPPLLTWDQIEAAGMDLSDYFRWHTINQSNQGSCCGAAGCQIAMGLRDTLGMDRIVLSQASLYGPGNGGRDQGMAIDTCLRILTSQGAVPAETIDQYDWQGFWRDRWPEGWKEIAKLFQAIEAWDCPTGQHGYSAITHGWPVLYGAKGHAVVKISVDDKDKNSWGADWGEDGDGIGQWTNRREFDAGCRSYGAWALRVVTDPTGDGDI